MNEIEMFVSLLSPDGVLETYNNIIIRRPNATVLYLAVK